MSRRTQFALEISALIVAGCAAALLVPSPVPDSLHLIPYGAKWLVYQWTVTVLDFVLLPLLLVLAVGALWTRLASRKRNYWVVWRVATIAAACFLVVSTDSLWYGHCRATHSVSECRLV
jgi:uncharacterized BrkB/YihY/UPF0761 family membrane protein